MLFEKVFMCLHHTFSLSTKNVKVVKLERQDLSSHHTRISALYTRLLMIFSSYLRSLHQQIMWVRFKSKFKVWHTCSNEHFLQQKLNLNSLYTILYPYWGSPAFGIVYFIKYQLLFPDNSFTACYHFQDSFPNNYISQFLPWK